MPLASEWAFTQSECPLTRCRRTHGPRMVGGHGVRDLDARGPARAVSACVPAVSPLPPPPPPVSAVSQDAARMHTLPALHCACAHTTGRYRGRQLHCVS